MKRLIKKIIPKFLIRLYHFVLAWTGVFIYGYPSKSMVIIGVLGTRGKTTVSNLLWSCLETAGYKTGVTGTAVIRIGKEMRLNPFHMTMPGRFMMQKMLAEMKCAGCKFAIVETPSEGVEQFRHIGIAYDAIVMTTLYEEKLETHNWSFERCKEMHLKVFKELSGQPKKIFNGKLVPKIIAVNASINEKDLFLNNPADIKITYGVNSPADIVAENISVDAEGRAHFSVGSLKYDLGVRGLFNVENALAVIAIASALQIPQEIIVEGLRLATLVPGRMEEINEGQNFSVFVDYAHDAVSLRAALQAVHLMKKESSQKIIVVTGGQGGGRDKDKRPVMGKIASEYADFVVVANEDPYYDDPRKIIEEIAKGCEDGGKKIGENLFLESDRREGIRRALSLAKSGDVVLVTGKGSEQSMMTASGKIIWDDREVVREELRSLHKSS